MSVQRRTSTSAQHTLIARQRPLTGVRHVGQQQYQGYFAVSNTSLAVPAQVISVDLADVLEYLLPALIHSRYDVLLLCKTTGFDRQTRSSCAKAAALSSRLTIQTPTSSSALRAIHLAALTLTVHSASSLRKKRSSSMVFVASSRMLSRAITGPYSRMARRGQERVSR